MVRFLACLSLLLALRAPASATTIDFAFDEGATVVAQGAFSYPTGSTGLIGYADLTGFTLEVGAGAVYNFAYVDSGALSVFRDLVFNTASQSFVSTALYGYPQILSAIGRNFDSGFFVRFDGAYKEVEDYATGIIQPIDRIVIAQAGTPAAVVNAAVPEPASFGLLAVALAALGRVRRRRAAPSPRLI